MQRKWQFLIAMIVACASGGAFGAIGDNETWASSIAVAANPDEARAPAKTRDTDRLRQAGESACREAVNTATFLGEAFEQIAAEILPMVVKTGEEVARQMEPRLRELEPRMRELGERLRGVARELEQSYLRDPPERD